MNEAATVVYSTAVWWVYSPAMFSDAWCLVTSPNKLRAVSFRGGCDVTVQFYNFFVIFGGQTNRPTDQQTDRPTDLGIEAPSRSLKNLASICIKRYLIFGTEEPIFH